MQHYANANEGIISAHPMKTPCLTQPVQTSRFSTHLPLHHSISLYLYVVIISIISIYLRMYVYLLRPMHVPRPYIPVYICRDVQRDTERSSLTWREINRYRKPFIETCVGIPVFIYPSMYPSIPLSTFQYTLWPYVCVNVWGNKLKIYAERGIERHINM